MNGSQQTKVFFASLETVTLSSDKNFSHQLGASLTATAEGLVSDGQKPIIKNWKVTMRAQSGAEDFFSLNPMIVQTNGTFTDTDDQAVTTQAGLLDGAINDEFGFQKVGSSRVSKVKTPLDAGATPHTYVETQFDLPRNVINLLNKEVSTERLQSLLLGVTGCCINTAASITIAIHHEISFMVKAKGITIR